MKAFSPIQIRWNEPLGKPECPYMRRWVFLLFGFSIRIHKWVRSDDKQHFHDHAWDFVTLVLRGSYTDITEAGQQKMSAGTIQFRKAEHKHYVEVPKEGALTLLLCGRPRRKWGFWVRDKFWRPLRYFSKFGLPPCDLQ